MLYQVHWDNHDYDFNSEEDSNAFTNLNAALLYAYKKYGDIYNLKYPANATVFMVPVDDEQFTRDEYVHTERATRAFFGRPDISEEELFRHSTWTYEASSEDELIARILELTRE